MTDTQKELVGLLRKHGIDQYCNGFIIDGDMAVKLKNYLKEPCKSTLLVAFPLFSGL